MRAIDCFRHMSRPSLDAPATPIGIFRTIRLKGIAGAIRIVQRVWGIGIPVLAEGITRGIGIERVGAQIPPIVPLLIIEPRGVGRKAIRGRLVAERVAVRTERIRHTIGVERVPGPKRIGRGVGIVGIRTELPEIFGMDGERNEEDKTEQEKTHGTPLWLRHVRDLKKRRLT